jgi:quercetin dioxygenase-like cupin family protein
MRDERIFHSAAHFQPSDGEPLRTVVTQGAHAVVVAWIVMPGQSVSAHMHPHGQDTWTILEGEGQYRLEASGTTRLLRAGDIAVAPAGCVHGVTNHGAVPLKFISVVCPPEAGYVPLG